MTDSGWAGAWTGAASLPSELIEERQRIERLAADADRRAVRGRLRRRAFVPAAVASGVLVSTGLLSAWARTTTPTTTTTAAQPVAATTAAATAASSEQAFMGQLRRTLRADQQAIAGLPKAAAGDFAASAAAVPAAGAGGASSSPPPVAALPTISLPAISAPPVHATTGASGIP